MLFPIRVNFFGFDLSTLVYCAQHLLRERLLKLLINRTIRLHFNECWRVASNAVLKGGLESCAIIRADIVQPIELRHMTEIEIMGRQKEWRKFWLKFGNGQATEDAATVVVE